MSYEVFARKYRPQTFDDVVGQEHITRTLKNAIAQDRLAQAYLFVGPRGTGKTSTARILAKALNCIHAPTTEPCGVCDMCREIAAGNSLNVLEFDAASNTQVDKIREIIIDNVRYAPARGKYKMYIVDEVHMLSNSSFNALLKTLEEPPSHVKFVFATTEVAKVPTTIVSRCQRFDLRRIPAPLIAAHLLKIAAKESIALANDAADAIARGAEGGLRDAESMLDQLVAFCGDKIGLDDVLGIFGFTAPETVSHLAGHIFSAHTVDALALLDAQAEGGKDLLRLLAELIAHLRDLLVYQVNPASTNAADGATVFSTHAPLISTERLLGLIDEFAAAEGRMKWAPNKKLHFEIAVIKAIQGLGHSTLTEVIGVLTQIRANEGSATSAIPARAMGLPTTNAKSSQVAPPIAKVGGDPPNQPSSQPIINPPNPDPVLVPAVADESGAAPAAPLRSSDAVIDGAQLWHDMIREIKSQRPLITAWVQLGHAGSLEGNILRVHFPKDKKMSVESLSKPPTRKFLEALLAKLAGRPIDLKLELSNDAPTVQAPLDGLDVSIDEAPAMIRHGNGAPMTHPSPTPKALSDNLENDPLIQKALKVFEGTIKPPENRL